MTEKIRVEIDNATKAGTDAVNQNIQSMADEAAKAQQQFDSLVNEIIEAESPQKQSAEAFSEQAKEAAEFARVVEQVNKVQGPTNESLLDTIKHLNDLKGLTSGSTQGFQALFSILGRSVIPLAAAAAAWESLVLVLSKTGKTSEDTRSNLDRIQEALGKTAGAVVASASEITDAQSGWKNFNDNVTSLSNGFISLLKNAQAAASGIPVEMAEASEKIDALNKRREDGAKLVSEAEERAAKASKEHAEAERIGRIQTTAAIDREIEALKREHLQAEETGKATEESRKRFNDQFEALQKRRISILEENAEKHKKFEEETNAAIQRIQDESLKRFEDAQERRSEAEKKAAQEARIEAEKVAKERLDIFTDAYRRELERQREAAEKAVDIERQRLDALRNLMKEQGAPSGEQLLQSADRGAILRRIQQQRAAEARRRFAETHEVDLTSTQDVNRFRAEQNRAARDAVGQATRDFRANRIGAEEFFSAQGQVAREQLVASAKQGGLSQDFVRLSMEQINTAQRQQVQINQMQQEVQRLMQATQEVGQESSRQRQRFQAAGNR